MLFSLTVLTGLCENYRRVARYLVAQCQVKIDRLTDE